MQRLPLWGPPDGPARPWACRACHRPEGKPEAPACTSGHAAARPAGRGVEGPGGWGGAAPGGALPGAHWSRCCPASLRALRLVRAGPARGRRA